MVVLEEFEIEDNGDGGVQVSRLPTPESLSVTVEFLSHEKFVYNFFDNDGASVRCEVIEAYKMEPAQCPR